MLSAASALLLAVLACAFAMRHQLRGGRRSQYESELWVRAPMQAVWDTAIDLDGRAGWPAAPRVVAVEKLGDAPLTYRRVTERRPGGARSSSVIVYDRFEPPCLAIWHSDIARGVTLLHAIHLREVSNGTLVRQWVNAPDLGWPLRGWVERRMLRGFEDFVKFCENRRQ